MPDPRGSLNFNQNEFQGNILNQFNQNIEVNGTKENKIAKEQNENIKIIIKSSELQDMELYVNSNDYVKDVIQKYKTKIQNDKVNIIFKNNEGKELLPYKTLGDHEIRDMSIIYASNENSEKGNNELTPQQIEKIKNIMKEKKKQGLITIIIFNTTLGNQFYFVEKNVKFQKVAKLFKEQNPRKNWFFLFDGLKIDEEKTLKELGIKMLSKILAEEYNYAY